MSSDKSKDDASASSQQQQDEKEHVEKPEELPSVEDRSLFLGCLTLIVKSAYDFDLTVKDEGKATTTTATTTESVTASQSQEQLFQAEQASMYNLDDASDETTTTNEEEEETPSQKQQQENDPQVTEAEQQARRAKMDQKIQQKMKQAQERHLVRRYKVAHDFIVSSAQHLLLDETSPLLQKELLPQLDSLLEPSSSNNCPSASPTSSHTTIQETLEHPDKMATQNASTQLVSSSSTSLSSLEWLVDNDQLQSYLEKLSTTHAGFRCLAWVLFQHLLHDTKESGYDARIRYWFKTLAVTLFVQEMDTSNDKNSPGTTTDPASDTHQTQLLTRATRKFESLEDCCADRLLTLAATTKDTTSHQKNAKQETPKRKSSVGNSIWKGVQIGGVGVGAGILLAVTGGLAAPGIAAGLAAIGMGAVAGTFLTLASSAAVVSIFGVAGGSLAAYKMNRRVSGLTEFSFHQELLAPEETNTSSRSDEKKSDVPKSRLFRTIGISGWINDQSDFQRPWGVQPTNPPIQDKVELLQRFYAVHNPDLVPSAKQIWKRYSDQEDALWQMLEKKYGCTPDHIFAKKNDKKSSKDEQCQLTKSEIKQLDHIIVAIGKVEGGERCDADKPKASSATKTEPARNNQQPKTSGESKKETKKDKRSSVTDMLKGWGKKSEKESKSDKKTEIEKSDQDSFDDEEDIPWKGWGDKTPSYRPKKEPVRADTFEKVDAADDYEPPAHLSTVWDYSKRYGGELYTVRWESNLMKELSESVGNLAVELAASAGQQVLKTTVAATLVFAAALPITVMQGMNSIDGTWTLVIGRSDEAGKELARSLLINKGGHRPVTLVGYSFGARVIYSCLKALAVYQDKWEEFQMELANKDNSSRRGSSSGKNQKDKKAPMCKVDDVEFDREPASIVEDVIIMGLPKFINLAAWTRLRQVVGGRLVNVYSRADTVLSYMFRYKQLLGSLKFLPVAGNATVAVPGVESIDATDLVAHHHEYSVMIGPILERVRHGQPVRASSRVVDEVALLKEAKDAAEESEKAETGSTKKSNSVQS